MKEAHTQSVREVAQRSEQLVWTVVLAEARMFRS